MIKEIAFFDLDGTLWSIKNDDVWIIDKEKPYKPVIILDKIEFSMISNGKYKLDELPLEYNGQTYYISKDLFDRMGDAGVFERQLGMLKTEGLLSEEEKEKIKDALKNGGFGKNNREPDKKEMGGSK